MLRHLEHVTDLATVTTSRCFPLNASGIVAYEVGVEVLLFLVLVGLPALYSYESVLNIQQVVRIEHIGCNDFAVAVEHHVIFAVLFTVVTMLSNPVVTACTLNCTLVPLFLSKELTSSLGIAVDLARQTVHQ